jgi:diphosphomevalonate decarboxylase
VGAAGAGLGGAATTPEELSLLARRSGSGSAARSVFGGYVEWPSVADPAAPARQVAPPEHWELCDLIAVVSSRPKRVSSRDGHARAASSPHFARRLAELPGRLETMRRALLERDLEALGAALEAEAIELHLVAMSSTPPIFYWLPGTLEVLARVRSLREAGVAVWATMDAGPNVHLICERANEGAVAEAVSGLPAVERLIRDRVGCGPRRSDEHLF